MKFIGLYETVGFIAIQDFSFEKAICGVTSSSGGWSGFHASIGLSQ